MFTCINTNLRKGSKPTLKNVSFTYFFCWNNMQYRSLTCLQSLLEPIFWKTWQLFTYFTITSDNSHFLQVRIVRCFSFKNDSLFFKRYYIKAEKILPITFQISLSTKNSGQVKKPIIQGFWHIEVWFKSYFRILVWSIKRT